MTLTVLPRIGLSLTINKVLVWTHTGTLFLISRLDVLVAAKAATGCSCEKSEFGGTTIIFRSPFFFFSEHRKKEKMEGRNEKKE